MDVIDWRAAQRIGERVAGSPPPGGVRAASVEPLAHDFAQRVSEYSGLEPPRELPPLEAVDRGAWIAANLRTMRPLVGGLSERLGDGAGPLAGVLRSASGFLLGAQIGALTGVLSQRVLGQYDVALLDDTLEPRLLLLAPNLAIASRSLSVDRDELVAWVTIHEITHAVQFTGAPWLRGHLGAMLKELIDGLQVSLVGGPGDEQGTPADAGDAQGGPVPPWQRLPNLPNLPDPAELREIVERARNGELLRLTLGEDRWQLVERMQAVMSLIEGHAEHTMDAVGADVLPSLPRLRAAMNRRRESRGLPWRVLERLLGLEMKLRQYEVGRRFCDEVVARGGTQALARVWSGPEQLPSSEELRKPQLWLARTDVRERPGGGSNACSACYKLNSENFRSTRRVCRVIGSACNKLRSTGYKQVFDPAKRVSRTDRANPHLLASGEEEEETPPDGNCKYDFPPRRQSGTEIGESQKTRSQSSR